jgi:putative transposase
MYLPDVPCHVIQRGNNRNACFFSDYTYQYYLDCLYDASQRYGLRVHAYVLMTNHVHLLMTPARIDSISLAMQSIGRRYVQTINKDFCRTGTLWESRHKASLVDKENYLLACMRYIELNPVRANMVSDPQEYRWTSYRSNALNEFDKLVNCHEVYNSLGGDMDERVRAYRLLFASTPDPKELALIRRSALFSMPTGNRQFKAHIEQKLGRKIGFAQRGRPSKNDALKCK